MKGICHLQHLEVTRAFVFLLFTTILIKFNG